MTAGLPTSSERQIWGLPLSHWAILLMAPLLVKAIILVFDHEPMFRLGDSRSYLHTALTGWIPPDRSFTYGYLLRIVSVWPGTLTSLVVVQSLAGVACCWILGWVLLRFFTMPWGLATLFVVLNAIEPTQLAFERYLMTEAFCLLALAVFVALLFSYLKKPRLSLIAGFQLAAIVAISLRFATFYPLVSAGLLAPVVAVLFTQPERASGIQAGRLGRLVLHLAVSAAMLVLLHTGYRQLNGFLSNRPPAYLYDDGFFALAAWSSLILPEDLPPEIAPSVTGPGSDERRRGGAEHRWGREGMVSRLRQSVPNRLQANHIAKSAAWNAAWRDPAGLARLAWANYRSYWSLRLFRRNAQTDLQLHAPLPSRFLETVSEPFDLEIGAEYSQQLTPTKRLYRGARSWFLLLTLTPLFAFAVLLTVPRWQKRYALLLLVLTTALWTVICLGTVRPTFRYLHPVAWLALLVLGVLLHRLFSGLRPGFARRLSGLAVLAAALVYPLLVGLDSKLALGWVQIAASATPGSVPPATSLSRYRDHEDRLLWEVEIPSSAPIRSGHILVDARQADASIAAVNPDRSEARIAFTLCDESGQVQGQSSSTLAGLNQSSWMVNDLFRLPPQFFGSLSVESDRPVALIALSTDAYGVSRLPVIRSTPSSAEELVFLAPPGRDGGFQDIGLLNTSPAGLSGSILALESDPSSGSLRPVPYTFPAGGARIVSVEAKRYLAVKPAPGDETPHALARWRCGAGECGVSLPPARALQEGILWVESGTTRTGVSFANPEDEPAEVSLTLFDMEARILGRTRSRLEEGSTVAVMIDELFDDLPSEFRGWLTLEADRRLFVSAARITMGADGVTVVSPIDVVEGNGDVLRPPVIIPHVASGSGFSTQILLINAYAREMSGRLTFFDRKGMRLPSLIEGIAGPTHDFALSAGSALLLE